MDWEEWRDHLFLAYLKWISRPAKIKHFLHKVNREKRLVSPLNRINRSGVKVAVMQLEMKLYQNPLDFVTKMNSIVDQAAKEGVQLLVLPEDNLTQLIGLLPGIDEGNDRDHKEDTVKGLINQLGQDIEIIDILNYIGPVIEQISLTTFAELARFYGIYLMSGSGMLPGKKKNIFNTAYLFGPDGKLLLTQNKTHLLPLESSWGLKPGDQLKVIETKIGKLALPICMDATYFEPFRIIRQLGAEIVMLPIANPDPDYNYWTALRGIWGRVQESKVYGLKSAMVGNFLGFQFTGQSGIYAPIELTRTKDGIIAEAKSYDREEMVIAELNLEALSQLKIELDSTKELWDQYYPQIYYYI